MKIRIKLQEPCFWPVAEEAVRVYLEGAEVHSYMARTEAGNYVAVVMEERGDTLKVKVFR